MKKLLLVSIIIAVSVFLYQNVELELLSKSQKNYLIKEINIIHQPQRLKELLYNDELKQISETEPQENNQMEEQNQINQAPQLKQVEVNGDTLLDPNSISKVSPDIIAMLQKVSFEDQMKVASILLKRFSISELNDYRKKASNGINEADIKEIKDSLFSRLTEEDLLSLKEIADNYLEKILFRPTGTVKHLGKQATIIYQ